MRSQIHSCRLLLYFCVHFHFMFPNFHLVLTDFIASKVSSKKFVKLGDINLGVLMSMSNYDVKTQSCDDILYSENDIHLAQVLDYAVQMVNQKRPLPNKFTLGFVFLDDCSMAGQSVIQSLTFMPQKPCIRVSQQNNIIQGVHVVGVIGCIYSSQTIPVARLLSSVQIPLISFTSSSDELSQRDLYPYFIRTVASDRFQFSAILSFIKQQGWVYASIVFEEGSYGRTGLHILEGLFDKNGMCFGAVVQVSSLSNEDEMKYVAEELMRHEKARVVILLASRKLARDVIATTGALHNGSFIWFGSDVWGEQIDFMSDLGRLLWGALVITEATTPSEDYDNYFRQLTLGATDNPWFPDFWQKYFNCNPLTKCASNLTLKSYQSYPHSGRILDVVYIYANVISKVLQRNVCEFRRTEISQCITGPRLLKELRMINFTGYHGQINFDDTGEHLSKYQISQILPASGIHDSRRWYIRVPVAKYDAKTERLILENNLTWEHHWLPPNMTSPVSQCSVPCKEHESVIFQEHKCCWVCHPCRSNERLIKNGTACEACPIYMWPDNHFSCTLIPVVKPQINSLTGLFMTILALCSLISCLAVLFFYVQHRNRRIIKASAKAMSYQMLFAVSLGYITIMLMQFKPDDVICIVIYWLFCLSFALLYGPLLVRSFCIFRIFQSAKRSTIRPSMVGPIDQLLLSAVACSIQIVICAVQMMSLSDWHKLTMKDAAEKYVELSCDMHISAMTSFLVYNLILLAMCSILAYKTRRLPLNFNESRYISICVSTTLIIWLTFIPSYMLAPREYVKTFVMALALALNHSVAIVFLFLPKVYGVMYLEEFGQGSSKSNSIKGSSGLWSVQTQGSRSQRAKSRVTWAFFREHLPSVRSSMLSGKLNFKQWALLKLATLVIPKHDDDTGDVDGKDDKSTRKIYQWRVKKSVLKFTKTLQKGGMPKSSPVSNTDNKNVPEANILTVKKLQKTMLDEPVDSSKKPRSKGASGSKGIKSYVDENKMFTKGAVKHGEKAKRPERKLGRAPSKSTTSPGSSNDDCTNDETHEDIFDDDDYADDYDDAYYDDDEESHY